MTIGDMNQRVTIEKCSDIKVNENGFSEKVWTPVATCWAEVKAVSGKEIAESNRTVLKQLLKVTIRYYPGLDTSMQIKMRDKNYNILSVDDVSEKGRVVHLVCEVVESV